MNHRLFKVKLLGTILLVLVFASQAIAQFETRAQTPVLAHREFVTSIDEPGTSDHEVYLLRSGNSVNFPLSETSSLRGALESGLSTKNMTGLVMYRQFTTMTSVRGAYNGEYIPKGSLVEARIIGRGAGTFKTAELQIEPTEVIVEISGYVQVGVKNNVRIFLKPGTWRLKLHTLIRSIQYSDGDSWNAKNHVESPMKGKKFGSEKNPNQIERYDDRVEGLPYFPGIGPFAYGVVKVSGFFKLIFKRPNIVLPTATELFFQVTRVEGTYLSAPVPKGSPAISGIVYNQKSQPNP